ncbi:glycosyltransferase family 4 protein [Candidatus Beckwithbacteria bacterium]|nr:glycosyltransferase family 4 protein [Candidatus Beckwithbacteria bacterium]
MKIAFIRGQYINNFELQSYYPMLTDKSIKLIGFGSQKSKHQIKIPNIKLFSPVDLPDFPYKLPILNRFFIDAMYLFRLENNLKHFDIAHARETYFHFSKQAIIAKQKRIVKKTLITCSETIPFNHETIWGRKTMKQFVRDNTDHFHCLTQKAKECLIKEGVGEEKITVINYGINLKQFKPIPKKTNQDFTFLFIGRLEDQKGVKELLEAWQKLKQNYQNIKLKIIGKGPLKILVEENGIKPEFYPYEQIPQITAQADCLILPSKPTQFWEEYYGMVLLEAMACGVPIISTNSGAIPEILGQTGIIVNHSSSQQLFKAMVKIIENKNLRQELSQKGLERVKEKFDCRKQAQKLKKLYQKILNDK